MRPTESKTRENIIAAKQRGEKRETIASWFNVSISTIDKVWKRLKETGSFLPTPYTGRKSELTEKTDAEIRETIKEIQDITLEELIDKLSLPLTVSGLCRKLSKMVFHIKKDSLSCKPRTT